MEIMGGPQRDVIYGTEEQDIIYGDPFGGYGESQPPNDAYESLSSGRGGNDKIDGLGAGDLLFGDAYAITGHGIGGNDKLIDSGSDGRDELYGDAFFFGERQPSEGYDWPIGGNDYLKGGELSLGDCYVMTAGKGGNDQVIGTTLLFGDAWYLFSGEGGNDHLIGGETNDQIYGDAWEMHPVSVGGNDRLVGNAGTDELYGEAKLVYGHEVDCGNDHLWGGSDHDILYGDGEQLYGFVTCGNDVIDAGSGDDTAYGDGRWFHGCCVPDLGNDRLFGGSGNDTLFGDVAFFGGSPYRDFAPVEEGITEGGNDRLYGGSGDDVLVGGPGSDLIYGGTGNDTAAFLGDEDDFSVAYLASKTIVTNIETGDVDSLIGVEHLAFGSDALALLT